MNTRSNSFFYFFISIVSLLIISLQYSFWYSPTGIINYMSLSKDISIQAKEVNHKELTNKQLYSEVVSLRNNSEVLESLARENLGLIDKGEVFYSVK